MAQTTTNFDRYLERKRTDPEFEERFAAADRDGQMGFSERPGSKRAR